MFVQTRGTARAADYAFLGGAPPEPWWRAYRDVTAFDHPTVLVTSDGARWASYLSGVPSSRVDAVGTVVRWTLVLDGPCGAPDAACVPAAVGAWLDDVAAGGGPGGRLAAALDARLPAVDIERWQSAPDERPVRPTGSDERHSRTDRGSGEVRSRVLAALATLPAPAHAGDEPGDWIGTVAAAAPRAAFVGRVAALIHGAPGRALLLNLVDGPAEAQALLDPVSPVAVLVESADPRLTRCTALRPVVEAKKAPAPRATVAAVGIAALPLVALFGTLAMTALLVMLLFWLL